MPDTTSLDWMDDALCVQVDSEIFFPEDGKPVTDAKRVCLSCEVRAECLEYALDNNEAHGVWGGLSERDRYRLKRGLGPTEGQQRAIARADRDAHIFARHLAGETTVDIAASVNLSTSATSTIIRRAALAAAA